VVGGKDKERRREREIYLFHFRAYTMRGPLGKCLEGSVCLLGIAGPEKGPQQWKPAAGISNECLCLLGPKYESFPCIVRGTACGVA